MHKNIFQPIAFKICNMDTKYNLELDRIIRPHDVSDWRVLLYSLKVGSLEASVAILPTSRGDFLLILILILIKSRDHELFIHLDSDRVSSKKLIIIYNSLLLWGTTVIIQFWDADFSSDIKFQEKIKKPTNTRQLSLCTCFTSECAINYAAFVM